ncbi:MAG: hypothetical protein BWY82_02810 [Verrucomicrobia bacterium ADurb.Bin474]|nr:MAG: hypothetical protein BWY82_02810 [Verrucomicrobia bacterium ADurb.Bin474]
MDPGQEHNRNVLDICSCKSRFPPKQNLNFPG